MGVKDPWYAYGRDGLASIYGQLTWIEHSGAHETAKEEATNKELAAAIWRAVCT